MFGKVANICEFKLNMPLFSPINGVIIIFEKWHPPRLYPRAINFFYFGCMYVYVYISVLTLNVFDLCCQICMYILHIHTQRIIDARVWN